MIIQKTKPEGEGGLELSTNCSGVAGQEASSFTDGVVGFEINSSFSEGEGVGKYLFE